MSMAESLCRGFGATMLLVVVALWMLYACLTYSPTDRRSDELLRNSDSTSADLTPQWSSDGQHIIVSTTQGIVAVNSDSGERWNVTHGGSNKQQHSPSLSSDGRVAYQNSGYVDRLLFIPVESYKRYVEVVPLDGAGVKRIAGDEQSHSPIHPVWSPDASWIAFLWELGTTFEELQRHLVVVDSSDLSFRSFPVSIRPAELRFGDKVVWSGDSRWLAFPGRDRYRDTLSVIGRDGSGERVIAEVTRASQDQVRLSLPAWSTENDRLYFVRRGWESTLYSIERDGTNEHALASLGDIRVREVKLSPDGNRLLLDGAYVVNIDGTELKSFEGDYGVSSGYGSWSPDGSRVAVAVVSRQSIPQTAVRALYTIALDGSGFRQLLTITPTPTPTLVTALNPHTLELDRSPKG